MKQRKQTDERISNLSRRAIGVCLPFMQGSYINRVDGKGNNTVRTPIDQAPETPKSYRIKKCLSPFRGDKSAHKFQKKLCSEFESKKCGLLMLKVDQQGLLGFEPFFSPQEAQAYVSNRCISDLMRKLGINRWVWILSFEEDTQGWPHWHCIVDLTDIEDDLSKKLDNALHYWRDVWRIGSFDIKPIDDLVATVSDVTRHFSESSKSNLPNWALDSKYLRCFGSSGSVEI